MFGSFGLGGLMMLLIVCIPILLLLGIVAIGAYILSHNRGSSMVNQSQGYQPVAASNSPAPKAERYCSHCGAGLQADWTHCPQCGAPIQ
jgi:uncharacterized paraquat-inducible protein A